MQTILQILCFWVAFAPPAPHRADVVVYGSTAGGVIAAVSAAREGLQVILVTPDRHLGGMVSGGLGWTDYGKKPVIGGGSLGVSERGGRKCRPGTQGHPSRHAARAPCAPVWQKERAERASR